MQKIVQKYRTNGRRRHGKPLKRETRPIQVYYDIICEGWWWWWWWIVCWL